MNIKSAIPNLFTLGNLFLGIVGIILSFQTNLEWAAWCMLGAAILDFFDGFAARLLHAQSEIGKQLDSLADMVSFGALPGILLFHLISITLGDYFEPLDNRETTNLIIALVGLMIPLFSALRLAKFNTDEEQSTSFIGVPTPAVALFVASIVLFMNMELNLNTYAPLSEPLLDYMREIRKVSRFDYMISPLLFSTKLYLGISIVCSLLLVTPLRFIALKFKSFKLKDNIDKLVLLVTVLTLLIYFYVDHHVFASFPLIFIAYLIISLAGNLPFFKHK